MYEVFISEISHLLCSKHGGLWVTESIEGEIVGQELYYTSIATEHQIVTKNCHYVHLAIEHLTSALLEMCMIHKNNVFGTKYIKE